MIAEQTDFQRVVHWIRVLEEMSGTKVTHRFEKERNIFEFFHSGRCIKTVFTYNKASLFAQGMEMARKIDKGQQEKYYG